MSIALISKTLEEKVSTLINSESELDDSRKSSLGIYSLTIVKNLRRDVKDIIFICTHNSRRSHLSQIWAQIACDIYDLPFKCYSGGTEVTAFYKSGKDAIAKAGFEVTTESSGTNPKYDIKFSDDKPSIKVFSKKFEDAPNPSANFISIVNCSRADESCPFIEGAVARLLVLYEDPKKSDGTPEEAETYEKKSDEIGRELLYLFKQVADKYKA